MQTTINQLMEDLALVKLKKPDIADMPCYITSTNDKLIFITAEASGKMDSFALDGEPNTTPVEGIPSITIDEKTVNMTAKLLDFLSTINN